MLETEMLKKFLRNEQGNYAVIFALAALPIFGSVGLAFDYSNVSRLRHDLGNSLDAAGIAAGKEFVAGVKTDQQIRDFAEDFFKANFDQNYVEHTVVTTILPTDANNPERELKVEAELTYPTLFGPVFALLTNSDASSYVVVIQDSTLRMRNVAEIALVLDNSGSMSYDKFGNTSGVDPDDQRITLLKTASKQLVTTMIDLGDKIHQVNDPVKFSLVPFSASVNIGAGNATKSWMDTRGISPIHHEHMNWGTPSPTNPTGYRTTAADGAKLNAAGVPLTRFSIYNSLKFRSGGAEINNQCEVWKYNTTTAGSGTPPANCAVMKRSATTDVAAVSTAAATAINSSSYNLGWLTAKYAWRGCVEMRGNGYDLTDETPSASDPASLFVPSFAPDEFGVSKYGAGASNNYASSNNWWPDYETDTDFRTSLYWASAADTGQVLHTTANTSYTSSIWWDSTSRPRMVDVAKYIVNKPYLSGQNAPASSSGRIGQWQYYRGEEGPNLSCTTDPIFPLSAEESDIHDAIDDMEATSNTNVPEGLAWGWRTVSHGAPFTEGVPETRRDVDKVVILLTDGANTYADMGQGNNGDLAGQQSGYAAWGYTGYAGNAGPNSTASRSSATNVARIFQNTTASKTTHTGTNFQEAMDQKMLALCQNIKDENIILMTVALDLDPDNYTGVAAKAAVNKALEALESCAGESKARKDASGNPEKLFWNAKSDTLGDTFEQIADELSNLRFTN
jgi:Flp pilus assembly protein TadG